MPEPWVIDPVVPLCDALCILHGNGLEERVCRMRGCQMTYKSRPSLPKQCPGGSVW